MNHPPDELTFYQPVDMRAFAYDNSENPRRRGRLFKIDRETYRFWRANAGNVKARRRWRRRNVPNSQRLEAQERADWIERAESDVARPGVTLRYGDHVVNVTGQTNEEMAQTAARLINGEEP